MPEEVIIEDNKNVLEENPKYDLCLVSFDLIGGKKPEDKRKGKMNIISIVRKSIHINEKQAIEDNKVCNQRDSNSQHKFWISSDSNVEVGQSIDVQEIGDSNSNYSIQVITTKKVVENKE